MRIAILTFHRSLNCGALLQAWALKTVLERMGHKVEFPNCGYPFRPSRWRIAGVHFQFSLKWLRGMIRTLVYDLFSLGVEDISRYRRDRFFKQFIGERRLSEREFDQHYDLVIAGSDQVWNVKLVNQRSGLFLGETIPKNVPMISYAASCGDLGLKPADEQRVVAALDRYEHISVRERLLQQQLSRLMTKPIFNDLDPTLLLTAADYEVLGPTIVNRSRPYVYVYTLNASQFVVETAREIAKRLRMDLIMTPAELSSRFRAPKGVTYGVSPDRMIGYMRGACCVLAESFHGTVFALLHHKAFLSLREQKDEVESRPASLLNQIGLGDRLVDPSVDIDEMIRRLSAPLPDSAYERLAKLREASLSNLKTALEHVGCITEKLIDESLS